MEQWRGIADDVLQHVLYGMITGDAPADQGAAAGSPGYANHTGEGRRILDNLASRFGEALGFINDTSSWMSEAEGDTLVEEGGGDTSSWLSETELNTLVEEGGISSTDADTANSTLDSAMWDLAASARAQHAGSYTTVPGGNNFDGDLFDSRAAITVSDAITATFLAQFRTARATFAETPEGLVRAMRIHTEWIDARDARTQGLFIVHFDISRGINRDPASMGEDTQNLMIRLWASSPAYYWYVRFIMIVGCGVDGRVPSFDMRLLTASTSLWFMVSSYAPWLQQRLGFRDRPLLGGVFALSILGRLMASILAKSGVEFGVCLVDILCNFPGVPHLYVCICVHLYIHIFIHLYICTFTH